MASLQTTLDPNAIDPARQDFGLMPSGEYVAQIIENEVKPTNSGNGLILALTWEVLEGEYVNRKVWQNINYQHESAQAQAIGQGQIKNICDAIGYTDHLSDGDVLMFHSCRVQIGLSKKQEGYEQKNEIKAVKPYTAEPPATKPAAAKPATTAPKPAAAAAKPAGAKPAAKPAAAPPGAGARPWASKPPGQRAAPANVDDAIPF